MIKNMILFSLFAFLVLLKMKFKSGLQVSFYQFSNYSFYPSLQAMAQHIMENRENRTFFKTVAYPEAFRYRYTGLGTQTRCPN